MPGYVTAVLVLGGLFAIYRLLIRITAQGGRSGKDARSVADQVLAESDLYRGARSEDGPAWDGRHRLAEPVTEGWPLWPVAPSHAHDDDEN